MAARQRLDFAVSDTREVLNCGIKTAVYYIYMIQGTDDAFIVKDDIEYAYMNIIPLWAFGLNY